MNVAPNPTHESIFIELKACVLVPTYNNAQTLAAVIKGVAAYTHRIIVVNDGSTDDTEVVLRQFPFVEAISYMPNKGKGHALQTGFRHAMENDYRYAITIDSDGQHYPDDLPVFLEAIANQPDAMIIGARNMEQAHIPGKSTFGNKFSNFWFWVETGISLPDTQSGYRLYPLAFLRGMKFFTTKYEFEIEVPVRVAWRGATVISVPVSVYYPPAAERISHFRPFKDFSRISVLNTALTFIALLYIHPRNFIRKLGSREGWRHLWAQMVVRSGETNREKATSIAFGVFMGIFPVWGFQLAIGVPLAIYFKMNKALFLLAANVSIFPFTPVFWALSLWTGKFLLGYKDWSARVSGMTLRQFKEAGIAFFLGGAVLATASALAAWAVSWALLQIFRKNKTASPNL
ncbi:MAG: DUF2062 domain-containing protein [Edaphocola sp.]